MNTIKHCIPELLSPAGGEEALRAAIDSGADAVYLGAQAFGARASAANFDGEALLRATDYAHLYHARVHVTVNTLVKEKEWSGVREVLDAVKTARADAVIVQDLGVARLVREEYPSLKLHASTQTALSNASDAAFAKEFGFSRVVLARECTLEDIRRVAAVGVETEVFAHGALCTAVSGRCLFSSAAGGRSGNRGRCAQPCRLPYIWNVRKAAWLSLRDLCAYPALARLWEAGVCSLKLEGRLKSPEYVAVVTSVYRRALDDLQAGRFDPEDPAPVERLRQIFNRGGFTTGHACSSQDAALCEPRRVAHEGLPLGRVISVRGNLAALRVSRPLHDGDSLQLRGRQEADLRYSGPEVASGGEAVLRLRPGVVAEAGTEVVRLQDARQLEEARSHAPKPIFITMEAVFAPGQPMRLTLSDGTSSVTAEGEPVQPASKRAALEDDARRQLSRLGDTPFALRREEDLLVRLEPGCFLPVSSLNALRRDGVEKLALARRRAFWEAGLSPLPVSRPAVPRAVETPPGIPGLTVRFSLPELGASLLASGAKTLWFQPRSYRVSELEAELRLLPPDCRLVLPAQCSQRTLDALHELVLSCRDRLGGVVAQSMGQLSWGAEFPLTLGDALPVTNRAALLELRSVPADGFTLWQEWTRQELRDMLPFPLRALCRVYGRDRLMLLHHCPARVSRDLREGRERCRLCRSLDQCCGMEQPSLKDQKGYSFPLRRVAFPEGCQLEVLNALPADLRAFDAERRELNAGMLVCFTVESPAEQLALTRAFAALDEGQTLPPAVNASSGRWRKGVE